MTTPVVELKDLRFGWPRSPQPCLDLGQLSVEPGETLFLHGPSGCGKSTLLSIIAGVLPARTGQARLLGVEWQTLTQRHRDRHRVDHVGYLFQQFNLLPYLSALDNVLLPCRFSPRRRDAALQRAASLTGAAQAWLADMDLDEPVWRRAASTLSVGQQQRVAAARALIGQPELIIADEPTSALDEALRDRFLDRLLAACRMAGSALILVSHDRRIASRFGRELSLPRLNRVATTQDPP